MTALLTTKELERKFERLGKAFCFDTETAMAPDSFKGWNYVRLLQFCKGDEFEFYCDTLEMGEAERELVGEMLQRSDIEVTGQNLAFDYRVMLGCGIYLGGKPSVAHVPTFYDTMLASQIVYNGRANIKCNLAAIVKRECAHVLDKTLQTNNWMEAKLTDEEIAYAMDDVRWTIKAGRVLHKKLKAQELWNVYRLECALIPATVEMEATGMRLDPNAIGETLEIYEREVEQCRACFLETLDGRLQDDGLDGLPREEDGQFNTRIKDSGSIRLGTKKYAGFNLNSAQQVLKYFNSLGIEPVDDAGKGSLDKKVLARFQSDELVRMYRSYKNVEKRYGMAQKLTEHADPDHRIRARFMPLGTGTGRWSSSSPNLQNIPRDPAFRCAFRAPEGFVFVEVDFSAMELRIAAALAGEQKMLDAFNSGKDVHTVTASLMYGVDEADVTKSHRQAAKSANFGLLYGSHHRGLCNYFATVGVFISMKEAANFYDLWHAAYPAFKKWHEKCEGRAVAGDDVRTVIGRRRYLAEKDNKVTTQANNVVQGTGADIAKAALIEIHRRLGRYEGAKLVATVHDSFLVECRPQDAEEIKSMMLAEMEDAGRSILGDKVRLTGEGGFGPSWGECK
jgi:DNA polymerase I-like protein with 3'-5' exonuclease and polymerase domains